MAPATADSTRFMVKPCSVPLRPYLSVKPCGYESLGGRPSGSKEGSTATVATVLPSFDPFGAGRGGSFAAVNVAEEASSQVGGRRGGAVAGGHVDLRRCLDAGGRVSGAGRVVYVHHRTKYNHLTLHERGALR
jgi:hypothetical protein